MGRGKYTETGSEVSASRNSRRISWLEIDLADMMLPASNMSKVALEFSQG
jgi:hypothetical protein